MTSAEVHAVLDRALTLHPENDEWADLIAAAVRFATAFYVFDEARKAYVAAEKVRNNGLISV
jgi:hypothetical protein